MQKKPTVHLGCKSLAPAKITYMEGFEHGKGVNMVETSKDEAGLGATYVFWYLCWLIYVGGVQSSDSS